MLASQKTTDTCQGSNTPQDAWVVNDTSPFTGATNRLPYTYAPGALCKWYFSCTGPFSLKVSFTRFALVAPDSMSIFQFDPTFGHSSSIDTGLTGTILPSNRTTSTSSTLNNPNFQANLMLSFSSSVTVSKPLSGYAFILSSCLFVCPSACLSSCVYACIQVYVYACTCSSVCRMCSFLAFSCC